MERIINWNGRSLFAFGLGLENDMLDRALPDVAQHIWCELDSWEVTNKSKGRKLRMDNGERSRKKVIGCGLLECGAKWEIVTLSEVHLVHWFTVHWNLKTMEPGKGKLASDCHLKLGVVEFNLIQY
jgi:hypothetical protein